MRSGSSKPYSVEQEPLTGGLDLPYPRPRSQRRPSFRNMVKVGVFVFAALYAVSVCWPVQAESKSTEQRHTVSTTSASSAFTVSKAFPTGDFSKMDFMPKSQEAEPRPQITRVGGGVFDDALVNPTKLPSGNPTSEGFLPKPSASLQSLASSKTFKQDAMKNWPDRLTISRKR